MLNTSSFIGYIITEIVFTSTDNKQYCKFKISVPRNYKKSDEEYPLSDIIPCIAFNITAEMLHMNFTKGKKICVSGRMESSKYTDKDGVTRYDLALNVREWYFIEPKPKPLEFYEKEFN